MEKEENEDYPQHNEGDEVKLQRILYPTVIHFVLKYVCNIYKTSTKFSHLLRRSNHSTFCYLGQFAHAAWTPVISAWTP